MVLHVVLFTVQIPANCKQNLKNNWGAGSHGNRSSGPAGPMASVKKAKLLKLNDEMLHLITGLLQESPTPSPENVG